MKYIGMLMIGFIFSGVLWLLFALISGEAESTSLLVWVVITQNIIIGILLVYIIELIHKIRSPR
ncbi:hypothetical protein ACFOZY_00865 [Chungangia koreensis]|uniref:Uncharacterized protein n=1 Tax=Chungangia koreensis TaxID=752657 RepID=A0ABV8WZ89_9LACT